MTGSAQIIQADARELPLADDSVDLIVTSPPYFALRSYQDGGEHYSGQIGSEATPAEFVDALLEVTAECVRVLKPTGSIFLNLGDKYSSGKSLCLLPERFRIRCIDELGLICRSVIVWSKPNGLPESVTDRVRRSHEDWMHFTLQPRYFSAVDEIREPHARLWDARNGGSLVHSLDNEVRNERRGDYPLPNPLGKLPGSVWSIPTEPLQVPDHLGVDHFAAFPTEWPRRIIQGWSPAGVCVECGEGRRPVADSSEKYLHRPGGASRIGTNYADADGPSGARHDIGNIRTVHRITGYTCACDGDGFRSAQGLPLPATRPAVILDPFGGTGTTALVAKALGRHGISVDMSADYSRLAEWRVNDPAQLAKAARVEKPPKQVDGQLGFDLEGIDPPAPKVRGNAGSSIIGIPRIPCPSCGFTSQNGRAKRCQQCGSLMEGIA